MWTLLLITNHCILRSLSLLTTTSTDINILSSWSPVGGCHLAIGLLSLQSAVSPDWADHCQCCPRPRVVRRQALDSESTAQPQVPLPVWCAKNLPVNEILVPGAMCLITYVLKYYSMPCFHNTDSFLSRLFRIIHNTCHSQTFTCHASLRLEDTTVT